MDVTGPQPGNDGFKEWPAMYGGAEALEKAALEASQPKPEVEKIITGANDPIAVDLHPQQILTLLKAETQAVLRLLTNYEAGITTMPVHKGEVLIALHEVRRLACKLPAGALPQ